MELKTNLESFSILVNISLIFLPRITQAKILKKITKEEILLTQILF